MAIGQRPPLIVIENVVGLLHGDAFRGLCESLAALDMNYGALFIDARHFVPQSRPRVFVVAVDAAIDADDLQIPFFDEENKWYTKPVLQAYSSLPKDLKKQWRWWRIPKRPRREVSLGGIFEEKPTGIAFHSKAETKRLLDLMTERNLEKIKMAKKKGGLQIGFLYKRTRGGSQRAEVRFDGLAGCLRTPRGGSSRQTVVVVKGGQVRTRLLSPVEAARLMGAEEIRFPPDFSYNDAYYAMGDGVAVPVVRHISKHLLTPLAKLAHDQLLFWKGSLANRHKENGYRKKTKRRAEAWAKTKL